MSSRKKKVNKKVILIKTIASVTVLMLMFLSFFYASDLEPLLKMRVIYNKNEVALAEVQNLNYSVTYLDIGQGNSCFIDLPDGKCALIDGGNTMYGEVLEEFLREKNVNTINYMIATHADADHIGGLNSIFDDVEIINIFRPFQICGTGSNAEEFVVYEDEDLKDIYNYYIESTNNRSKINRVTSSVYKEFITNIYSETYSINNETKQSNVCVFYDGLKISGENYEFEFYAPFVREEYYDISQNSSRTSGLVTVGYGTNDSNNNSAIFTFTAYGTTYLFTGDASSSSGSANDKQFEEIDFVNSLTEQEKQKLSKVDVYLAGHHGSSYSSGEDLLALINPRFVVFSVGVNNTYGHPASEVIFRLEKTKNLEKDYLLRTDQDGTIIFSTKENKVIYALSSTTNQENTIITYKMFAMICTILLIIIIWNINIKSKKNLIKGNG